MDAEEILRLLLTNPSAAADKMEEIGHDLIRRADIIRKSLSATEKPGVYSQGGVGDRVKIIVTGPDGVEKQRVDTGDING